MSSKQVRTPKRRSAARGRPAAPSRFPGRLSSNPAVTQKFRFQSIADGTDQPIYNKDLTNLLWFCTSSSVGYKLFSAVQLVSVEVWGIDDGKSIAGQDAITLTWGTGGTTIGGPPMSIMEFGNAIMPAHFKVSPPAGSAPSIWGAVLSSNSVAFYLSCGSGTVVDVTVRWILQDQTTGGAAAVAAGASTVGTIYQNYLDGSASSTAVGPCNFAPVGPRPTLAAWT
jgi:hypothetical protein